MNKYYFLTIKPLSVPRLWPRDVKPGDYIASSGDYKHIEKTATEINEHGCSAIKVRPYEIKKFFIYQFTKTGLRLHATLVFENSEKPMIKANTFTNTKALKDFLSLRWGPVWVELSANGLTTYPGMKGVVGMIIRNPLRKGLDFEIDWTGSTEWATCSAQYPNMKKTFYWDEINILYGDNYAEYTSVNSRVPIALDYAVVSILRGHVVVIDYDKWNTWVSNNKKLYSHAVIESIAGCQKYLGYVLDIDNLTVRVSFARGEKNTLITHVPKSVLLRVPEEVSKIYFKCVGDAIEATTSTYEGIVPATKTTVGTGTKTCTYQKAKFDKRQIVLVNSCSDGNEHQGLIGIVMDWTDVEDRAFRNQYNKSYLIDFDILPNRNLMLSKHPPKVNLKQKAEFKQNILDEFDPDLSWFAYWKCWRSDGNNKNVFVCKTKTYGKIHTALEPNCKDITKGYKYKIDCNNGKKDAVVFDRELDINYDKDKLLAALSNSKKIRIAIEDDNRNKNETKTIARLHLLSDSGTRIEFSILLGTLKDKRKHRRRFDEAFEKGEIRTPFQLQRYLISETKGNFFTLISSEEFSKIEQAIETF